ncbi:iron-sulfur cluster assembly scaffold protein [Candidatus Woesearchaeota archaeon]|nr:iron-sulfur cluster assembly scaffold protein [Candidatus Woesearchaeota archaeon]
MSFKYSDKLMRHFHNPKNAGKIDNADGIGIVGNRSCGDVMHLYITVKNNIIVDIKFKTLGCAAAISASDLLCELAKGKTIDKAMKITKQDLVELLGGLPAPKLHCSLLAIDALHKAIEDYTIKNQLK